jgi:CDP-paratose 2-epimerase
MFQFQAEQVHDNIFSADVSQAYNMKVIVSGCCGFVGSTLINALLEADPAIQIFGFDNLIRPGSYLNREPLQRRGVRLFYADLRNPSDLELLPPANWIIDAAANPSVLAAVDGRTSSRQLLEHNLFGTVNLLELAKQHGAGFILLSTSRVYSITRLATISVIPKDSAFIPASGTAMPQGLSERGVSEMFSTEPPLSLYGASKLASEAIALEYGATFGFPVWINRCGILAGAGQFGRADQGIFAYWINSYFRRRSLAYVGFDGTGFQVRDCLHPQDLVALIIRQMREPHAKKRRTLNLGGGLDHSISLAQLSNWCAKRFGYHKITADLQPRRFDVPWLVMDTAVAATEWDWKPKTSLESILNEIARHAEANPHWLDISAAL